MLKKLAATTLLVASLATFGGSAATAKEVETDASVANATIESIEVGPFETYSSCYRAFKAAKADGNVVYGCHQLHLGNWYYTITG